MQLYDIQGKEILREDLMLLEYCNHWSNNDHNNKKKKKKKEIPNDLIRFISTFYEFDVFL